MIPMNNSRLKSNKNLIVELGVKSDPIHYRYSFEWLFDLMAEERIHYLQLGTFVEFYFLSDSYFLRLKEAADSRNIQISSIFTSHRELGGFMSEDPEFSQITIRNYQRLIEIAQILRCPAVGSSMGGVLRDRLEFRSQGIQAYIESMKEMMYYAKKHGLSWLTMEPMSCYAEPPCNAAELKMIADELMEHHHSHSESTTQFGYCSDVSHGWVNEKKEIIENNMHYFTASFPYMYEFHFKNTDMIYNDTFGFEPENLDRGIVDVKEVFSLLMENKEIIPVSPVIGYLELPGPKLGRDYTDILLERMMRESLRYLKQQLA